METIIRVLLPLVAVVHICNCEEVNLSAEKKIFDSAEKKEAKQVDFQSLPLFKLDEEVQKELRDPKPLADSCEVKLDVLKKLVEYEKNIKDLHEGVQNNIKAGIQLAQDLLAQDGPKFLREEFDVETLRKVYNWDDGNVEHLKDLFKDIKSVYHNISVSLREKPSPLQIFFSKQRNMWA